jgi:hypothetical protein
MKKVICLVFVSVFLIRVHAQIKFGITAGMHLSDFSSATSAGINASSSNFFHGGVMVDRKLGSSLDIMAQALYTINGYEKSNIIAADKEGTNIGYIGSEKIGYIQIPILALYRFEFGHSDVNAGAGPYAAFRTNETLRIESGGDVFKNTLSPMNTTGVSPVVGGAEVYASLDLSKFFISAHYDYGFSNIYENADTHDTKWKLSALGFSLGFFLK